MAPGESIDFIDNYSAAYRRDIFWANDGFDPLLQTGENPELSFRLADKGYRMVFVPAAVVQHRHDLTVAAYIRRKFATGYWKVPLTRLHPERMVHDTHTPQVLKLQIVLASLIDRAGAGRSCWACGGRCWTGFGWLWAACGGLFLVSAAPFIAILGQLSWRLALFGVPMLFARALALGAGYLVGTIHFAGALPGVRQPIIPGWKRVIKRTIDVVGALVGSGGGDSVGRRCRAGHQAGFAWPDLLLAGADRRERSALSHRQAAQHGGGRRKAARTTRRSGPTSLPSRPSRSPTIRGSHVSAACCAAQAWMNCPSS